MKHKGNETDISSDYLALVRIGCWGGFLLGLGNLIILLSVFHSVFFAAILGFIISILLVLFFITYIQKTHFFITIILFCIDEVIMQTLFTVLYGTNVGYHLGILFLTFVIFYKTDARKRKYLDFLTAAAFIIYSFIIWCIVIFKGHILPVSTQDNFVLSIGFMLWLGISVITLATFYHIKFTKNEEDLIRYNDQLKELTKCDELTGLQNRRGIYEYIEKIKTNEPLFFVMCDVDYFKKVNDSYGHDIGDKVLTDISALISENLGKNDMIGRWGGEEFLLILPNKDEQQVLDFLEDIRMKISDEVFFVSDRTKFSVTMTFGMAQHSAGNSVDESIKTADDNLYIGKQRGRNCVIY